MRAQITPLDQWQLIPPTHAPDAERHSAIWINRERIVLSNEADARVIFSAPHAIKALRDLKAAILEIEGYWTERIDNVMMQAEHVLRTTKDINL